MQVISEQQVPALQRPSAVSIEPVATLLIIVWGLGTFLAGYYAVFSNTSSKVFGLGIVAIQALLLLLYFRNNAVNRYLNDISLSTLTVLHVWRVFAAWLFISYADRLPKAFISDAAYGDIIAGFLSLAVFVSGRRKWAYYLFNIVGLLDLMLAVGTGITLSLMRTPGIELLTRLPLILIPFFGVPISGLTHVVSLVRLSRMKTPGFAERVAG